MLAMLAILAMLAMERGDILRDRPRDLSLRRLFDFQAGVAFHPAISI